MLPSTCSREALVACPPFPPWNLPSFTVESTLSTPCSRSDPSLSLTEVRLSPTLTLSSLMIWYFGQTALFLSAKAAPVYLPTASYVALRPLFPFRQAPVCSSFSAEACAILHALCWSRQHQQVCHFSSLLLSDSRSVLSSIFLLISNSVADLAGTVISLLFYQATMGPRILIFTGKRRG